MTLGKRKGGLIYTGYFTTTVATSPLTVFDLDTLIITDPGIYRTETILVAQNTSVSSRSLSVRLAGLHRLDGGSMGLKDFVDIGLMDASGVDTIEYGWLDDNTYNQLYLTSDADYDWGVWIYLYSLETG